VIATSTALRPYLAIVSARFRMLLQYRAAALAGIFTQISFGFVLIMIYEAFYLSSTAPTPLPLSQITSYVWLGQALLAMVPWNADPELRAMVRSGAVAYELCRPIDLYGLWFARALAWRTAPTLLRAVPMAIFATAILPWLGLDEYRLAPPASPAAALGFIAALAGAIALASALSTLVHISLLWTLAADGIVMLATTTVSFLSGMIVPLPLFPDRLRAVLEWLPFAGLVDLPFRVYLGAIPPGDLALVLGRQLAWTLALIALGRWLIGRGIRRIVVQGG
jgi:ABC-2 type transport system permease protein